MMAEHQWNSKTSTCHSDDTESDGYTGAASPTSKTAGKAKRKRPSRSEWEIVGGLRDGEKYEEKPTKFDGYLHKKRNPPLKGWHKRYFVLEEGFLTYAKTPNDYIKGRHHGRLDIGLSVLSVNRRKRKIDIDAEEFVCHIRIKNAKWFEEWIEKLKQHRLCRQHELTFGSHDAPLMTQIRSEDDVMHISSTPTVAAHDRLASRSTRGSFKAVPPASQGKVIAWLLDNEGNVQCGKDLQEVQSQLLELEGVLKALELLPMPYQSNASLELPIQAQLGQDSSKRSSIGKILSFKGTKRDRKLADSANSKNSASNPALTKFGVGESDDFSSEMLRPSSFTSSGVSSGALTPKEGLPELKACTEFISRSQKIYTLLKNLSRRIGTERERLRQAMQQEPPAPLNSAAESTYTLSLKQSLDEVLTQNAELKVKISQINQLSVLSSETPINAPSSPKHDANYARPSVLPTAINMANTVHLSGLATAPRINDIYRSHSLSLDSKTSESFYDASEYIREQQAVSSVSSDDSSSSEFSDQEVETEMSEEILRDERVLERLSEKLNTGRRTKLPAPMTAADTGVLSLLTRNIGKDLSRISMPVTLNEPLNALQVLCEELEYSDLLDKAASFSDPYERMIYVAAFAVSGYASSLRRAVTKPFNPVLGETYEYIRLDKGWSFVAEQVSHHPPVSVCHAESKNYIFSQDVRVKTKFWGKSMEFHPSGTVSVRFPAHSEEYTWNKITTCVHNVLAGQRWVDQYGEMIISCKDIQCKLNFIKASFWSDRKHEVHGTITGADKSKVIHYLFGKWTEGIHCSDGDRQGNRCIWRPGSLPEDSEFYYGFTRFAMELNELLEVDKPYLPCTDTRFRPDQRFLELGRIPEAEAEKQRIEKLQREARKKREIDGHEYSAKWFCKETVKAKERYIFTEEYWRCRRDPTFNKMNLPKVW